MSKTATHEEQPVSVEFWDGKKCHIVLVGRNCQTSVKDLIDGVLAGRWQLPPGEDRTMSEPKICPFRNVGLLVDGEDCENIMPVLHQSQAYYGNDKKQEPRTILGIACCEDRCGVWNRFYHCCGELAKSLPPSIAPDLSSGLKTWEGESP